MRQFAPAKLNLYLHITGKRADGYHKLDSLVAFAGAGDEIRLEPATEFGLVIEGPQAAILKKEPPESNLIVKVARSLAELVGQPLHVKLTLIKNLPVASGIGGGSSDAAATLRVLAQHWRLAADDPRLLQAAALYGEDIPVCLRPETCYITEDGVMPGPPLPHCNIVLVNPNKGLPTAEVYKARQGPFSSAAQLQETPENAAALALALQARHNDLAGPASRLMPEIRTVLDELVASKQCLLARMSGSGATCFAFYPDRQSARSAAAEIFAKHPNWWVVPSHIPCHNDPRRES